MEAVTPEGHAVAARRVSTLGGVSLQLAAPGGGTAGVRFPASLTGAADVALVAYAASPHAEPSPGPEQEGGGLASGVVRVFVSFEVADLAEPVLIELPNAGSAETCKWWDANAGEWSAGSRAGDREPGAAREAAPQSFPVMRVKVNFGFDDFFFGLPARPYLWSSLSSSRKGSVGSLGEK